MTAAVTSPLPAAEVENARQGLRDDAEVITTVQTRTVEFDDGERRELTAPPMITMVEQELHSGGTPVGAFNPKSKPPTGIDALTLLAAIDNLTGRPPQEDRASWVWSWACEMSSSAPGVVVDAAKTVATWRNTTENLLDPPPRFQLRGQRCPSCHAEKVWDRTDEGAGENHARPALEVDPHRGVAHCLCCSTEWPPELFEHLRAVLEQQRHETLAAGAWDPAVTARTASEASLARLDELTVLGRRLAAVPDHAPRLDVGDEPVQCSARVPRVQDGEPMTDTLGQAVTMRCPVLLDADGACRNAERHLEPDVGPSDPGVA